MRPSKPPRYKKDALAADIVQTEHGPATADVAAEMAKEDMGLLPLHTNRTVRQQSEFELDCLCGAHIVTVEQTVKCAKCGRQIRIDWQAEIR